MTTVFPPNFLWGASTAAHQIEGNNIHSDWWDLERFNPEYFVERSGQACDSFNRWREDMAIVKDLGLNTYRFSIEWARIQPKKREIDHAMIDHYRQMVAHARELGLEPIVTLHHFTMPKWFRRLNAWQHPDAPQIFADYCRLVAPILDEGVTWALTINEPNIHSAVLAAQSGVAGPNFLPQPREGDVEGLIRSHHAAREVLKSHSGLKTGWSMANFLMYASVPEAQEKAAEFQWKYEDVFTTESKNDDFVGVQSYSRLAVGTEGIVAPPEGAEITTSNFEFYPEAVGHAIRHVKAIVGEVPILVTENGVSTDDDTRREVYLRGAVAAVEGALADGIDIRAYCHWSLLDNFEWQSGYAPRFGLVSVDRTTFARTPKPSADVYRQLVRERQVG
jgi:beta-glucosidase